MINEVLMGNRFDVDQRNTFHWKASVTQGRNVITKEKVKRARKAKAKDSVTNFNNSAFHGKWMSSFTPEQVVEMCDLHKIGGKTQKQVCEQYGVAMGTLSRMMEFGGLYVRAKELLK